MNGLRSKAKRVNRKGKRCIWMSSITTSVQLAALCLVLFMPSFVHAANFNIPSGDVTALIDAINTANSNDEDDTINLEAGIYTLTGAQIFIADGPTGLPPITVSGRFGSDRFDIVFKGAGAEATIIERDANAPPFRIFALAQSAVSFDNLTIRGGNAINYGGGILIEQYSSLRMTNCIVSNNSAFNQGGGINSFGPFMVLTNVKIVNNKSGNGGGIFLGSEASMEIRNSIISGNTAENGGGGIVNSGKYSSFISDTTISGNRAFGGGGIDNGFNGDGVLELFQSTLSENTASFGGGITNNGNLRIANTTISSNVGTNDGGGIITRSGGTPSGITSTNLNNVTITNNNSIFGVSGVFNTGIVNISNTIIAQNGSRDCGGSSFNSRGFNLIGNNQNCRGFGVNGDRVGTPNNPIDAKLGPLQNNGGFTLTHALFPDSLAINTGNPAAPGSGGNACEGTDQRGFQRPVDGVCDVGAFEFTPTLLWDLVPFTGSPFTPAAFDDNGFLLNPPWSWQTPGAPSPEFSKNQSSQITGTDNSRSCSIKSSNPGHVNWFDVTYTGKLRWQGHDSHYPFGDDDYNIKIFGPTVPGTSFMAGGTRENPDNIKGEFDSDETIDHFDQSAWWKMFERAVNADGFNTRGAGTRAGALIDGHDGVMTGLMGLDTFHSDNRSEIHPMHALAIRIAETPNPADDAWAVFVRNWGNEGYCGNNQHYVDRVSISIRIPRPPGIPPSATPSFGSANAIYKHKVPNVVGQPFDYVMNAIPGGDAVVTFRLNKPDQESYHYGELHLVWTPTGGSPLATVPAVVREAQAVDEVDEEEGPEESAEERALFNALSPSEREAIEAAIEAARPPVDDAADLARGTIVAGPPEPAPTGQVVFDAPDERLQEIRESSVKATCAATDNALIQSLICEGIPLPRANDDSYSTPQGTQLTVDAPGVLGNDISVPGRPFTAVLVSNPSNGRLTLNADGSFTYRADANFRGEDSFTYKANDGAGDSNIVTVTITITRAPQTEPPGERGPVGRERKKPGEI